MSRQLFNGRSKRGATCTYDGQEWVAVRGTATVPPSPDWSPVSIKDDSLIVPGPAGESIVGPAGAASTIPGPAGRDSTVPGPTGPQGKPGIVWRGLWSRLATYQAGEAVTRNGSSYIANQETTREPSANSRHWTVLAARGERGEQGKNETTIIRHGSPRIVQALERLDEIETLLEAQNIGGINSVETLFNDATNKGMAIRVDDDGNANLAIARPLDDYTAVKYWGCDGLALDDVEAGQSGRYATDGIIELDDWSAVIGTQFLSPGSQYMLSETEPGKLTRFESPNDYFIVQTVGSALSATQFDIEIQTASFRCIRDAEFDSECGAGVVVYSSDDGHVEKARADDLATAVAVGSTFGRFSAGNAGRYLMFGPVYHESKDWTESTGSPELVPGPYYLSDTDAGMMTPTAPTTPGHYRVKLGEATAANMFFIKPEPPELIE